MSEESVPAAAQRTYLRKVLLAASIGATVEWYDFFLYGTAAALVFDKVFFPEQDPLLATVGAFASFGVAYLARPLGGIVFGHFGDRLGRKQMLVTTLLIIGIGTFCIGVLPPYREIGAWAPLLLFTVRFLQGIGLGGEWGGAVLTSVENAPDGKRGLFGSLVQIGTPLGLLLGTVVFAGVSLMPEAQFLSWGWRIPFLASVVLLGVGYFVRAKLMETPAFATVRASQRQVRVPVISALRRFPKNTLLMMGARLSEGQAFNIFAVIVIVYGTAQLHLPKGVMLTGVLIGSAVECLTLPVFGTISDRIGRRPVFIFGAAFCALYIFPFFLLMDSRAAGAAVLAPVIGLGIGHSAMWAAQAALFSEVFSTEVRYSGTSFVYQVSGIAASGIVPLACTTLIALAGGGGWLVAWFVIAYALISVVSVFFAPETYRSTLTEPQENADTRSPALHGDLTEKEQAG